MSEKEYIVSLQRNVDYDQFWNEIENLSDQDGFIPARRVEIINNRDGSLRSCHYALTDQEAELLRNDPRVYSVEIPPDQRTDIEIRLRSRQSSDFTKTTASLGNAVNYGLLRHQRKNNIYESETTAQGSYDYTLDGTGVDVVIQDSGIQWDHPEFTDAQGISRVYQIDWYAASGLSGTQSANFYRDFDGHGTHVAGIAAGKTYGWAKNSRIYSVKVSGLEGSGDLGTGLPVSVCFDVIKLWHRNKPVDPLTGYKRPTVVNMSWGYESAFRNITGGVYRGTPWSGTARRTDYGMIGNLFGGLYYHGVRVNSVDVDIQEMIDEGIHIVTAAGNDYQKIDVLGGLDYDNRYTSSTAGTVYYHRGSSPWDNQAIVTGSVDRITYSTTTEQKASYSSSGPGVDVYACGTNIISSCSNTNAFSGVAYFANSNFKQVNISGTSMAAPQIAGMAACYLQINPSISPGNLKQWFVNNSTNLIVTTGLNNDYTNSRSLHGGNQRMVYFPFNQASSGSVSGVELSGVSMANLNLGIFENVVEVDPPAPTPYS